jgi:ribulose-5-phosphate 4-epimerase/fuculose-1-phosphate aldolase
MSATTALRNAVSVKDQVSEEEWALRLDLAALYRLAAKHGMTDLTYTHFSARIPGDDDVFLLNPYGLRFDQVTASSLVKIDVDGEILLDNGFGVNAAGFTIHSAVHMARHDLQVAAHTHTPAGMAISALQDGLMPLTQKSMRYYGRTAYHGFEGPALDLDERERIIADFGTDKHTMILQNHGIMVCASSVRLAWTRLYTLEKTMQAQLLAMASGAKLRTPPKEACEKVAAQWDKGDDSYRQDGWESQLRLLDRADPTWKH